MQLAVTSFSLVDGASFKFELSENAAEDGTSEEQDTEEKENNDGVKEFILFHQPCFSAELNKKALNLERNKYLKSNGSNVLTPPPKFI